MVRSLAQMPAQRRIVVAGEMLELGPAGEDCIAIAAGTWRSTAWTSCWASAAWRRPWWKAPSRAGHEGRICGDARAAGEWLRREVKPGDVVLLKASRGVRLERALEVWTGKALHRRTDTRYS